MAMALGSMMAYWLYASANVGEIVATMAGKISGCW
jgi:hypothetical protein